MVLRKLQWKIKELNEVKILLQESFRITIRYFSVSEPFKAYGS